MAPARGIALAVTVLVHGMIIYLLATHKLATSTAYVPPILVTFIDKPPRPAVRLTTPALMLMKPKLSPIATPHAVTETPAQPLVTPDLLAGRVPVLLTSPVASAEPGTGSDASGAASNSGDGGPDITIARRVRPIYSDDSVRAREQGYVSVSLLIDERGYVRKVKVVKSSGFRRLDQSVVHALRQWTFKQHADGSPPTPVWVTFSYGFHLISSNSVDPSTMSLSLVPYDPALAEQIRAAAVPTEGTRTPTPKGADALRRLIARIQTVAPEEGRDSRGPLPALQLVVKLGEVKSIQFLGIQSHGLDLNEAEQVIDVTTRQESQWELYKVTQRSGISEWLVDVTRDGAITNAQALTCASSCPGLE